MKPVTTIARRDNTAMLTTSIITTPTLAMLRDEVPEGAMLWGFDPTVSANEDMVFAIDDKGTREVDQHLERPFKMVTWAAKKIKVENTETHTVNDAIRIVLIDDEGETLDFVSVGVAASLDLIRQLRGDGPYSPPVEVVFKRVPTRNGFGTIKMRTVPKAKEAKTK